MQNKREQLERRRHIDLFKRDRLLWELNQAIELDLRKIGNLEGKPYSEKLIAALYSDVAAKRRRKLALLEVAI